MCVVVHQRGRCRRLPHFRNANWRRTSNFIASERLTSCSDLCCRLSSHHLKFIAIALKPLAILKPRARENPVAKALNHRFFSSLITFFRENSYIVTKRRLARVNVTRNLAAPHPNSLQNCFVELNSSCKPDRATSLIIVCGSSTFDSTVQSGVFFF